MFPSPSCRSPWRYFISGIIYYIILVPFSLVPSSVFSFTCFLMFILLFSLAFSSFKFSSSSLFSSFFTFMTTFSSLTGHFPKLFPFLPLSYFLPLFLLLSCLFPSSRTSLLPSALPFTLTHFSVPFSLNTWPPTSYPPHVHIHFGVLSPYILYAFRSSHNHFPSPLP